MTNAGREPAASLAYADAGVSIDAGNDFVEALKPLVRTTRRPGADAELGGFGGLFDLKKTGFRDPLLVSATDGVGTKLKIAIDTGILDTVGIDLVAMNVNDIVAQGAEPLFFLDYFATGRVDPKSAIAIVSGIAEGCRQAGCALIGGETAEMPGIYEPQEFDLAGFSVGAVERDRVLPRDVAAGDVILGLASSGVHSNGFSLVRLVAERAGLSFESPSPFCDGPLGRALLTPTRIYVKPLLAAMQAPGHVKALAHITGGGFVDNIPRVLPADLAARIDLGAVAVPPVFRWLANAGPVSEAEMLRTFNCGVGMVVVVSAEAAEMVTTTLAAEGETVFRLGTIEARTGDPVAFDGTLDVTFA